MLQESPECRRNKANMEYGMGGFSALGLPTTFHGEWCREMREFMTFEGLSKDVFPILTEQGTAKKLESCFDRVMMRPFYRSVSVAEPVHRDECPSALTGDTIFGGWVNLNAGGQDQVFHCCPGTHTEFGEQNTGYAPITDPALRSHYESFMEHIAIPVGHMLIFYERLVHEVANSKPGKHDTMRMFCGFRLTDSSNPLFGRDTTLEWIQDQAVPRIKSGQWPTVYPSAYSNFPDKHAAALESWSVDTFVDACLIDHTITSKSKSPKASRWNGHKTRRVKAHMDSLVTYGLPLHPAYTAQEAALMFPQRSWKRLRTGETLENGTAKTVHMKLPTQQDALLYQLAREVAPQGCTVKRPRPYEMDAN